jgi:hypothetical protein
MRNDDRRSALSHKQVCLLSFLSVLSDLSLTDTVANSDKFQISSTFLMYFAFSGLCGFMLSLTSFWVVNTTSPTTYRYEPLLEGAPGRG